MPAADDRPPAKLHSAIQTQPPNTYTNSEAYASHTLVYAWHLTRLRPANSNLVFYLVKMAAAKSRT